MKKALAIALALVLVVVISVAGTMAYFTAKTEAVKNTFTVGNLFDPNNDDDPDNPDDPTPDDGPFVLYEHEVTEKADGSYEIKSDADEVDGYDYTVLPGVDLPKDPFIRTDDKLELAAFVFVEVVDGTSSNLTVTVDTTKWAELADVTGPKGGKVYVLKNADGSLGPVAAGTKLDKTYILKDNKIVVANAVITDTDTTLDFYGYMIQAAGFDTAADAWAGYVA